MRTSWAVRAAVAWWCPLAASLDNGLSQTPIMGYNTWNDLRCEGITAKAIYERADKLVSLGLRDLGYVYLNIDDCWASGLDADGRLVPDAERFPDGLGAVAEYVHSRGLKLGIYSDRGYKTCAYGPASGGKEALHAAQFAAWGIDYLKYDSCYASNRHEVAFAAYGAMRDALNATGRPIAFSLCGWNAWYAPKGASLGNSWRIAPDVDEWANLYVAVRTNEGLAQYAAPGAFNDADMLVGSDARAAVSLPPHQVEAQFSLWAVMAAPLILGAALLSMPEGDLATYSNKAVLAINQDPLGKQGHVVHSTCPPFHVRDNFWMSPWSMPYDVACMWTTALTSLLALALPSALFARRRTGCCCTLVALLTAALALLALSLLAAIWTTRPTTDPCQQVWARPLSDGSVALAFINFAKLPATLACDAACLKSAGVASAVRVRDVVNDVLVTEALEVAAAGATVSASLIADGGSALYRLEPLGGD